MCAFGSVMALMERMNSGKGQVIDCSITAGAAYIASFLFHSKLLFITQENRGINLLDSGCSCYDSDKISDGRFMAVGSLEPQFCVNLAQKLDLNYNNPTKDQLDGHKRTKMRPEFEANFSTKSMKDWGKFLPMKMRVFLHFWS